MGLVWITGSSGVGKSSVHAELRRRGYVSFDADDDGICAWHDRRTGKLVENQTGGGQWAAGYAWRIQRLRVEDLAREADLVFLCGAVENETEVWDLFSIVVCLVVDDATLRRRLMDRTTNNFGKDPGELATILAWNRTSRSRYEEVGATIIDATRTVAQVVDEVVAIAGSAQVGSAGSGVPESRSDDDGESMG